MIGDRLAGAGPRRVARVARTAWAASIVGVLAGAAIIVGAAACRSGDTPSAPRPAAGDPPRVPPAGAGDTAPQRALPAGQQCLPAMICDAWSGCAIVAGGKVIAAERLPAGEPVRVENACSNGVTCTAAKATPAGTPCPPRGIPPVIEPPSYTCVWDGAACRSQPKP